MSEDSNLNSDFLEKAAETLRVMAHPIRLSIIDLLHSTSELSVTEIHQKLDIEQAVASHHLRILKGKNIVKVRRAGQRSMYSLTEADYYTLLQLLSDLR